MQDVREQTTYRTRTDCRLCGSEKLEQVWSAGITPLANNYLTPEQVASNVVEPVAPLDVYYCQDCHLVQLRDVVNPDLLFKHYLYVSSTSLSFVQHFEQYAQELLERFDLGRESLVVDIGSNDGVLLRPLKSVGVRVLGVDPAENLAALASAAGIPTIATYFSPDVARRIRAEHGPAQVISANNVFAHTDGIEVFVESVKELLAPDGVFVFEVQYLRDLVEKNLFDIVYHEHVNYYHVTPLVAYFKKQGIPVFDVERVPVHGGSLRVFVGQGRRVTARLDQILAEEEATGLNTVTPYHAFATRIAQNKKKLRTLINAVKAEGRTIAAYGAPAKATTLMYAFGLTGDDIQFIVDDAPLKQGRLMPGTHVPIKPPEALYENEVDYCLILAWNFAEGIMKTHARFKAAGGKWIVPVPEPKVV